MEKQRKVLSNPLKQSKKEMLEALLYADTVTFSVKRIYQISIEELRELATSPYGLVDNDIRRKVWPVLLNTNITPATTSKLDTNLSNKPEVKSEESKAEDSTSKIDPQSELSPKKAPEETKHLPLLPQPSFTKEDKYAQIPRTRNNQLSRGGSLQTPSNATHRLAKRRASYKAYDKNRSASKDASEKSVESRSDTKEDEELFITCGEDEKGSPKLIPAAIKDKDQEKSDTEETMPVLSPATSQVTCINNTTSSIQIEGASSVPKVVKFLSEKDELQVQKDINRSMHNFDFFNTLNEETAASYKEQLKEMILELLYRNGFHYYQGYNDFCSVFLLILGKKQGIKAAEVASKFLIKDFLLDSFEKGVRPMLFMLNDLLKTAAPDLHEHFVKLGVISQTT
eukprot:TRINITY_DN3579_c0_g1_i1.p1 TRINITY_DN3579_c0_g1~~TRINITY_DN3579_c0_g1_i1.p1  ORF type:complete len:433 (-),score=34.03 TRINITY_DN3579_c0_g1_i1:4025-5215(-)